MIWPAFCIKLSPPNWGHPACRVNSSNWNKVGLYSWSSQALGFGVTTVKRMKEQSPENQMADITGASSSFSGGGFDDEADKKEEPTSVSVNIDGLDPEWVNAIKQKRHLLPSTLKSSAISISISRVPPYLLRQDKNAYTPQVVSIGPLHYDKRESELRLMEVHKWRNLNAILSREEDGFLEQCLLAVKQLEEKARKCYSEVIDLDSNSFVEMMVLDACFIIAFLCKNLDTEDDGSSFKLAWLQLEIMLDLVKLENQIPFCILQCLFDLMRFEVPLIKVALNFFSGWSVLGNLLYGIDRTDSSALNPCHLLHLLHGNICLSIERKDPPSMGVMRIQCASKLEESGIKFRKRDDYFDNLLDIKFERGVVEIPFINVEGGTNSIFRNLIAFEQCYFHCKKYVTTYADFMDCLIDSGKDVQILRQKGIIESMLSSDEELAILFNNIPKEAIVFNESFYLSDLCDKINRYCDTTWPKLRVTLMHDYFKNPWAIISFLGALLLLLLTVIQTIFSGFQSFR